MSWQSLIATALGLLLAGGCSGDAHPQYPVRTSELVFLPHAGYWPSPWLDNDRILIAGQAVKPQKGPDGKEQMVAGPLGVYVLNTRTNTYVRHADLHGPTWFMCSNHGFIAYAIGGGQEGDAQLIVKAGQFGQEKLLPSDIYWSKNPELAQCHGWPRVKDDPITLIYELRPEDGHIYVGHGMEPGLAVAVNPTNQNDHVKLLRPGLAGSMELPILAKEMAATCQVNYSEYLGKYVVVPATWRARDLRSSIETWPGNIPQPIYLISANGTVETIEIPPGTWRARAVFPTREGLIWVSNDAPSGNSKQAGGWLLHDGKVIKLFDHLVETAAVSADGCRFVYQNNNYHSGNVSYVEVIDLCEKPQ